ncbi:MAG: paraquat-inducible protein A [Bacteroidia bacterium]|nr:paraquat-inducible protein A [Bacteroidia bacterium]
MRIILSVIISLALGFSAFHAYKLYHLSKSENELKYDYAEINKIKYGLFNIDVWKQSIYSIMEEKIGDFEITGESYDVIRDQIEKYLEQLYEEYFMSGKLIESLMGENAKENNVGKILLNLFKGGIEKQIEEIDFKSKIPDISNQLILELKKRSPEIKKAISKEISDMLLAETGKTLVDRRQYYFKKYEQEDFVSTNLYLEEKIESVNIESKKLIRIIIISLLLALLLLLFVSKILAFKTSMIFLSLVSILFLALGLALPMIDLDARLSSVDIQLLDKNIHFDEQVMYFQSKSIIDVTRTLLENHALDMKIVGLLILLFSIILPAAKMILSLFYLFVKRIRDKVVINTIIFYMGKWSMADVFVVAIFMSYIGMYGLINSQIVDTGTMAKLDTLNYSKLSPGIIFFTSYCILSIIMSSLIQRHYKRQKV